ncbi:helix-turn-helix domain-containing protein [Streptomyces sp. WMMC940]|uniref:helix-turn-helix domain-containing protein n=1 Tax=Streptomyces sp. WMMC940 TaxID=3015153 RepID=UPI0022B73A0D|nr:helix-turn-helix domain-containing protein [Streptomyces sp. WMMC940]MCZ7462150.1 helix-turn-helix domain-containing protein [Streptomyces sp. WMMC940]
MPEDATAPSTGETSAALSSVASQLRDLRKRGGLTVEAAALRLGLSPAHLSRLETGQRQPSLPVLLTLARTYGTTVSDLLGETPPERDPVIRASTTGSVGADGWTYRQAGGSQRAMQALRVHVPPNVRDELVRVHAGEEWLYLLTGRLRLSLGGRDHTLEPGDSAHYDSLTPHRITAVPPGGADLLFVHTLLQSHVSDLCVGGGDRPTSLGAGRRSSPPEGDDRAE